MRRLSSSVVGPTARAMLAAALAAASLFMWAPKAAAEAAHEFLLDDQVIKNSYNTTRSPVQAAKYDLNPVLSSQYPWETSSDGLERVTSPTIWVDQDADVLRMLYWAREPEGDNIIRCAAESTNGRDWTRTWMDQYPYSGYSETNIAAMNPPSPYTGISDFWVYENPRPDLLPNSKYIALTEFRDPRQTFIITSNDGLHWDFDNRYLVTSDKNDTHPSILMTADGQFRAYIRGRIDDRRIVDMVVSDDLVNWSERTTVMDIGFDEQAYGMPVRELDGVYVSLMPTLRVEENVGNGIGPMYCEIVTSRDGIEWDRDFPDTPVIDNGEDGTWDAGIAYHNAGILEWQGKWITAYGGGPLLHGQSSPLMIGVAEFDRGRLFRTGQTDTGQAGWIVTEALKMNAAELLVNADLAGGEMTVSVVDATGKVVSGYASVDCTLTAVDDLRYSVTWSGHSALPNGQYSLRVNMSGGAALYGFEGPALYSEPEPLPPGPTILTTRRQSFDSASSAAEAGWVSYMSSEQGCDIGYQESANAGGQPGEAGGACARSGSFHYYADTSIGVIDSAETALSAKGKFRWQNNQDWSGGEVIGWFGTDGGGQTDVLGFVLHDPAEEGLARMEPRLFFSSGDNERYLPHVEIPIDTELEFEMIYDPTGGDGFGLLSIEFFCDGESLGVGQAVLLEGDKDQGIYLDAFGIHNRSMVSPSEDCFAELYFDDLEYTAMSTAAYGDANCDGVIDDDDLSLLLANWGQSGQWAQGNFNGDDVINDDDLSLLLANWSREGSQSGTDGSAAVPEPATVFILGIGALAAIRRVKK